MATNYFLKLSKFEGPLDLLVHLIRVNEIDIFNIDIFLLTNQYLDYLRLLKYEDLRDAGEFVEMAATLIEIKSRMLLPQKEREEADSDASDAEDPRKTLQERLILHEQFRAASEFFDRLPQLGVEIQTNFEWKRLEPDFEDIEAPLTGNSASLVILYEQMLRQLGERKPPAKVEAVTHRVTLEEKIEELSGLLKTLKFALFQGFYKQFASRYELVVYILAVLELSRWGRLKIFQQDLNGPIWIYEPNYDEKLLPVREDVRERNDSEELHRFQDMRNKESASTIE